MIEYREDCKWCRENRFNEERIRQIVWEEIGRLLEIQKKADDKVKEKLRIARKMESVF